jgi:hypothetical protein
MKIVTINYSSVTEDIPSRDEILLDSEEFHLKIVLTAHGESLVNAKTNAERLL